ncbi:hypothetical protein AB9N12_06270 [Bacteroides sp. AN502(2024)]|uniref:hypothetical protein n=1 Tax=Bacteroides sp. AN502(2024) TaxID=3160599 RepID=UPI0035177D3D
MKKTIYIYSSLCISLMFFIIWSCTDSEFSDTKEQHESEFFSLEEAKSFFEEQMEQHYMSTRSIKEAGKRLTPGDFIPKCNIVLNKF